MGKYCCFNCPEVGHDSTRDLDDLCPICNNEYGFPLKYPPKKLGKYEVISPINRGFYGAVYKVKNQLLDKDYVLKVIPKSIYERHRKDFYHECRAHAELAKKSQHIVDITDAGEEIVEFSNGIKIDCFYAVLEFVPGDTFGKILSNDDSVSATKIAQISIDLLRILDVLRQKQKNHNDLHPENIIVEILPPEQRRAGEIHDQIRVVAIDIGSLTTENRSGDSPDRHSDVHWVAHYLIVLSEKLLKHPEKVNDQNYRLANLLEDRAKLLYPTSEFLRQPHFDELMEGIRNCFTVQVSPWEEPLKLLNFNDTYNAQTLDPWFVPSLLVDPNDEWLKRICGKGPLVITGMRGCGKTMMLRALQFHARAAYAKEQFKNDKELQIEQLKHEGYVGIYVSCNKLLDEIGKPANEPLHQPYSRLFIRYGIEALKALRHLSSISSTLVKFGYYKSLIDVYKEHLSETDLLEEIQNEYQLEQRLLRMIYSLNKGEAKYIIQVNPANAFPALASAIRNSAGIWNNHYILFLLDDVSTRYLGENNIKDLLSSLLFQSEDCAFKLTSEVQTIELVLYSPGKIERARKGRDFDSFDLGSAVNNKIRNKGGKKFVSEILERRAKNSIKHPQEHPISLLGDTTLESIAKNIVTRGDDKTIKKRIYHGLTAMAGVCIGDIGDMINLYDLILRRYDENKITIPIPAEQQNECFQDLCSIRLHEISRRGSNFKDFALSFAEASFELLMKSARDGSTRLRQYYSIYIRVTTGDTEKQYEKIRELLDAGLFVYSGGTNTPRTLGNDTNPISQFKLTYRKLYGLSKLIGLTNGDRFELSGQDTENWLNDPANGKEILMKNVGGAGSNVDEADDLDNELIIGPQKKSKKSKTQAKLLFEKQPDRYDQEEIRQIISDKAPKSLELSLEELKKIEYDYLITALGFEERTVESIKDLIKLSIKRIILIEYPEKGKRDEILDEINKANIPYEIIRYEQVKTSFSIPGGTILCDITGMSKSLIYNTVRDSLKVNKTIYISHAQAETYFPLNEEIEQVLGQYKEENNYNILDIITDNVLKGEERPYEIYNLLISDVDDSKRNFLVGFSSPKYERLFKILENRQFDKVQTIVPINDSKRSELARLAAEVVTKTYSNADLFEMNSYDIKQILEYLTLQYQMYYIDQNFNFEICLTGTKRQTIACAAVSAAFKVSHCWYVKPHKWDTLRFSKGIGLKNYFRIDLPATVS